MLGGRVELLALLDVEERQAAVRVADGEHEAVGCHATQVIGWSAG